MSPKVDENDIAQVREFTGVSREDAKYAIRNMDFNIARAVEYILSGEIERDKQNQKNNSGARGIMNTLKQHYTRSKSPAKQRKPSPSNTPEIIDVSDDEDKQMQLAMEMSLQQNVPSRGPSPNPTNSSVSISGGKTTPQFRPATGTDYHEGSWGVVLANQSQQEVGVVDETGGTWGDITPNEPMIGEPAMDRKRVEGQPVVLDPRSTSQTWGADHVAWLSALLTILHKIPRIREAFLLAAPRDGIEEIPAETWWNGGGSPPSTPSSIEEGVDSTGLAVLKEIAKIMAFLDDTERALAPHLADVLRMDQNAMPDRTDSKESETSCANFLQRFTYIVQSNLNETYHTDALPRLFNSYVCEPSSDEQPAREADLTEISASVPRDLSDAGTYTILDALERTIWWESTPAYIKDFSEVMLIRLKREDYEGGAGVEILPKLPMGRFAFEYYQQAVDKIRERKGIQDILEKLKNREEQLSSINKSGTKYQAPQILEATLEYVSQMEGKKFVDVGAEDDEDTSRMDIDTEKVFPAISGLLRSSIQSLNEELERIRTNTQNMEERLRTMMDFPSSITKPSSADTQDSQAITSVSLVYDLRGVIIDNNLFYFTQWEHITNPYKRKLAWYKAEFNGTPDITSVEEGEVLTVARDRGSQGVLTIYLRDDVPENIEKVLPPDYLREFIQRDNENFQKELNPPVIQVTETGIGEIMETEDVAFAPAPPEPVTEAQKSMNPFLNGNAPAEQTEKDLMEMDSVPTAIETNPFRRWNKEGGEVPATPPPFS